MESNLDGATRLYPGSLRPYKGLLIVGPQGRLWEVTALTRNPHLDCQSHDATKICLSELFLLVFAIFHQGFGPIWAQGKVRVRAQLRRTVLVFVDRRPRQTRES